MAEEMTAKEARRLKLERRKKLRLERQLKREATLHEVNPKLAGTHVSVVEGHEKGKLTIVVDRVKPDQLRDALDAILEVLERDPAQTL
jgi:hypothetical protein